MVRSLRLLSGLGLLLAALLAPPGTVAVAQGLWPPDGLPVTSDPVTASTPGAISDGRGGAYVTWFRDPDAHPQVRMLHLLRTACVDPAWPAGSLALSIADAPLQSVPQIIAGSHHDLFVSWMERHDANESRARVVRVREGGEISPGWPAGGVELPHYSTPGAMQAHLPTVPDADGGVYVAVPAWWSGDERVYVFHLGPDGASAPGWPGGGRPVGTGTGQQGAPELVAAPAGGVHVVWTEVGDQAFSSILVAALQPSGEPIPGWPQPGAVVTKGFGNHTETRGVPDGGGGLFLTWRDLSTGAPAFFATHMLADGQVDPRWPENGLLLADEAGGRQNVRGIVPDDEGGVFIVWEDMRASPPQCDVYALHIVATGAPEPGYPAHGINLCTIPGMQEGASVASDSEGGVRVAFRSTPYAWDFGSPGYVLLAALGDRGGLHEGWPRDGVQLSRLVRETRTTVVPDDDFGALVAWRDEATTPAQLRMQRVDHTGQAHPAIASGSSPSDARNRLQVFPQPASTNGPVHLRLALAAASRVQVDIFGADGRRIADLGARTAPAGVADWTWDGRDANGHTAAPGLVFVRARGEGFTEIARVARVSAVPR